MKKFLSVFVKIMVKFIPVDNHLILLESNPLMQDNTGALFEQMLADGLNKKFKIIWFVYEQKAPQLKIDNVSFVEFSNATVVSRVLYLFRSNYYYARAKYAIFSHRNNIVFAPRKGQYNFNLTHGVPIKDSIGLHMPQENVTDILATSDSAGQLLIDTYLEGEGKIRVLGYPRNDRLVTSTFKTDEKYIVWLPTYRKLNTLLAEDEYDFFPLSPTISDIEKLDEKLSTLGIKLYIKPHPAQKIEYKDLTLNMVQFITDDFVAEKNIHLYDFLSQSVGLITDYSSVYVDYLLTDKPVIFTFDDIEEYTRDWGFLVSDIYEYTPGPKVYDIEQLTEEISNIANGIDNHVDHRSRISDEFHYYKDGDSSKRVLDFMGLGKNSTNL